MHATVWRKTIAAALCATQLLAAMPTATAVARPSKGLAHVRRLRGKHVYRGFRDLALYVARTFSGKGKRHVRIDILDTLRKASVPRSVEHLCSLVQQDSVVCIDVADLESELTPEQRAVVDMSLNDLVDTYGLNSTDDTLYGCGDGITPFAGGSVFSLQSSPAAQLIGGRSSLPSLEPVGRPAMGLVDPGFGANPRQGPMVPGFISSSALDGMRSNCASALTASVAGPGGGAGGGGGGGGRSPWDDAVDHAEQTMQGAIDQHCARENGPGGGKGGIEDPGAPGSESPGNNPSAGTGGVTTTTLAGGATTTTVPASATTTTLPSTPDDANATNPETVAEIAEALYDLASAVAEAVSGTGSATAKAGAEVAVESGGSPGAAAILALMKLALAVGTQQQEAAGNDHEAKALGFVGSIFSAVTGTGEGYVLYWGAADAVGADAAAAIGVAGVSTAGAIGAAAAVGVGAYGLTRFTMEVSGADDWIDQHVLVPAADALWEMETADDGSTQGKGGGRQDRCQYQDVCGSSVSCADAQQAWDAVVDNCEQSDWNAGNCPRIVAYLNGCSDPWVTDPSPEGAVVCTAPHHGTLQDARQHDCEQQGMIAMPGQDGTIRCTVPTNPGRGTIGDGNRCNIIHCADGDSPVEVNGACTCGGGMSDGSSPIGPSGPSRPTPGPVGPGGPIPPR